MIHDEGAEAAVIGFLLAFSGKPEAETLHSSLATADFYTHHWQRAFSAWTPGYEPHSLAAASGVPIAQLIDAVANAPGPSTCWSAARLVATLAARRRALTLAGELTEAAHQGDDDRIARLIAEADVTPPVISAEPDMNAIDFMSVADDPYDWVIKDVLEAKDRLLITAAEGGGKSVLLAQLAVQVAAGVHPWTLQRVEPQNVLLIDLENADRLVRRRLKWLTSKVRGDWRHLRVVVEPGGIDLSSRRGQSWLAEKVKANRPRLLVTGPLYRMYAGSAAKGDIGGEDMARQVVTALDRIRDMYGCALILETHAPHGQLGGRDLRPFGSSVWLRWPEFGLGIRPDDQQKGAWKVEHWRGPRDQRVWPKHLTRSEHGWPWLPSGLPDGYANRLEAA